MSVRPRAAVLAALLGLAVAAVAVAQVGPPVREPSPDIDAEAPPGEAGAPPESEAEVPLGDDARQDQELDALRQRVEDLEALVRSQLETQTLSREQAAQLGESLTAQQAELEQKDEEAIAELSERRSAAREERLGLLDVALQRLVGVQELVEAGDADVADQVDAAAQELALALDLAAEWGTPSETQQLETALGPLEEVAGFLEDRDYLQAQIALNLAESHARAALGLARSQP